MLLGEYIDERLDAGEASAMIEGLQNTVRSTLDDAVKNIPTEDWNAEITNKQKESDGETLIWLTDRTDPSYIIQE